MRKIMILLAMAGLMMSAMAQRPSSPNGKLAIEAAGNGLRLYYRNQPVLDIPEVGYEGQTTKPALRFVQKVKADYQMLAGKRLHATNEANEYATPLGNNTKLVVRLYNDGRYPYAVSAVRSNRLMAGTSVGVILRSSNLQRMCLH